MVKGFGSQLLLRIEKAIRNRMKRRAPQTAIYRLVTPFALMDRQRCHKDRLDSVVVEVIRPRGNPMSEFGLAKFAWLNRLEALAPNVSRMRSLTGRLLKNVESRLKQPCGWGRLG
jgi:hypothetical protein